MFQKNAAHTIKNNMLSISLYFRYNMYMIITDILSCKRNKNRVNIYADGAFAFALYLETAVRYGLKNGLDTSALDMPAILEEDEKRYAMDTALNLLSYRARSSGEITEKLKQKNISSAGIGYVKDKLEEMGYLNDRSFAGALAEEYTRESGKGRKFIEQKLYEKGVPKEIIQETLESMETQPEIILAVAQKLFVKYKDEDIRKTKQKVFRALYARGFEPDEIKSAVDRLHLEE